MHRLSLLAFAAVLAACRNHAPPPPPAPPEGWVFTRIEHAFGDVTLTDVFTADDGAVVAVGWFGTILTNRVDTANPEGEWIRMPAPTQAHLTAIAGVANGGLFDLPAARGEMVAVGWGGTLLHYHPNPDGDPATDDGAWRELTGPDLETAAAARSLLKIDPACPDYDGDGIADDGDGDGWAGNAVCADQVTAGCDDNCRLAANGTARPLVDLDGDPNNCLDGPSPNAAARQRDVDGDGRGDVCDDEYDVAAPPARFDADLFAVALTARGDRLHLVAVGEGGALVSYDGPSAAVPASGTERPLGDPRALVAQSGLAYRFDVDCPPGTPPGTVCGGGMPPTCPAQCNPLRVPCPCPSSGQCCSTAASTGAGCADGSCGAAANGCDPGTGACSLLCSTCFRRLQETLRGVAVDGTSVVAVGAAGTVVVGDAADPTAVWTAPTCAVSPWSRDAAPLLAGISVRGGAFQIVGSAGTLLRYPDGGDCAVAARSGAPPAFLARVLAVGADRAYAIGDGGVLLEVAGGRTPEAVVIATDLAETLYGVAATTDPEGRPALWLVGGGGALVQGIYYEPQ